MNKVFHKMNEFSLMNKSFQSFQIKQKASK